MRNVIRNVLVPTDFSETGNNAVVAAVNICKENNAVLHLLHVVENRYIVSLTEPAVSASAIMREIDQEARSQLYNIYETIIRNYNIPVQIHMPTGIPFDEICKTASEIPIDLIVMGTHGASGYREFFIGTTTYSVIKSATRPVLSVPGDQQATKFSSVIFPVRSVTGIKEKFRFMQAFIQPSTTVHLASLCLPGEEDHLAEQKKDLYEMADNLTSQGFTNTSKMYVTDNLARQVLELSESYEADLIVINATLDYKWTQFFVGPYTQQVVNHARVPVLSFRNSIDVHDEARKENKVPRPHLQLFSGA